MQAGGAAHFVPSVSGASDRTHHPDVADGRHRVRLASGVKGSESPIRRWRRRRGARALTGHAVGTPVRSTVAMVELDDAIVHNGTSHILEIKRNPKKARGSILTPGYCDRVWSV